MQNRCEIGRVFLQPPVVGLGPFPTDAGSIRRVVELIDNDFLQDVSSDLGGFVLVSQSEELRTAVSCPRFFPVSRSGVTLVRKSVAFIGENQCITCRINQPE